MCFALQQSASCILSAHLPARHPGYGLDHQWVASAPLCSISASPGWMHHEAVKQTNPDFDALLVFLANWEAIERSALGRILTAGQLADVQELERLYALPSESPKHSSN